MNATMFIPSYDMLGLPAPPALVQLLMALTLALHWLFLGGAFGGTLLVLISVLKGEAKNDGVKEIHHCFVKELPFFLALAMTMGVAPLLFVQVLYGNLFYTANILQAFWWLGLIPLVIAIFYLLYYAWYTLKNGDALTWKVPIITCGLFFVALMILSSNATLMETPSAWQSMRLPFQGVKLYHGAKTLIPRMIMALAGLLALGGLFYALVPRLKTGVNEKALSGAFTRGMTVTTVAFVGYGCGALAFLYTLPTDVRTALTGGGGESLFLFLSAVVYFLALLVTMFALKGQKVKVAIASLVLFFLHLFALAGVRDFVRRLKIASFHKLSDIPVNTQWDSFLLWLVIFVVGLAVVGYLVKLTMKEKETLA